jgi:hypothetical protein
MSTAILCPSVVLGAEEAPHPAAFIGSDLSKTPYVADIVKSCEAGPFKLTA